MTKVNIARAFILVDACETDSQYVVEAHIHGNEGSFDLYHILAPDRFER